MREFGTVLIQLFSRPHDQRTVYLSHFVVPCLSQELLSVHVPNADFDILLRDGQFEVISTALCSRLSLMMNDGVLRWSIESLMKCYFSKDSLFSVEYSEQAPLFLGTPYFLMGAFSRLLTLARVSSPWNCPTTSRIRLLSAAFPVTLASFVKPADVSF
jgi:hypothetical protein